MKAPPAGVFLSDAAVAAAEAERAFLRAVLNLEVADEFIADIDALLATVDHDAVNVADVLEDLGAFATALQLIADAYGHWETAKHFRGAA